MSTTTKLPTYDGVNVYTAAKGLKVNERNSRVKLLRYFGRWDIKADNRMEEPLVFSVSGGKRAARELLSINYKVVISVSPVGRRVGV